MAHNIIAMVYDFDLTLTPYYMQKPIFERFNIKEKDFWKEKDKLVENYKKSGKDIHEDTAYLYHMIKQARSGGSLDGLTEKVLKELGGELEYFPGIPEFFSNIKKEIEDDSKYQHPKIKIEHYVVSSGLADMLRGSVISDHVDRIVGCEFFYNEEGVPDGVAHPVNSSEKVPNLYRIKKGVFQDSSIDVNASMPKELKRIPFPNMIYIGDGPSDVPALSTTGKGGGKRFAVYNPKPVYPKFKGDPTKDAFELIQAGRADFFVQADYREGTDLYIKITKVLRNIADKIIDAHEEAFKRSVIASPKH